MHAQARPITRKFVDSFEAKLVCAPSDVDKGEVIPFRYARVPERALSGLYDPAPLSTSDVSRSSMASKLTS